MKAARMTAPMRNRRTLTVLLAFVLVATITAGCGQKPGVNELYAGPVGASGGGTGLAGEAADGSGLPGSAEVPGAAGRWDRWRGWWRQCWWPR